MEAMRYFKINPTFVLFLGTITGFFLNIAFAISIHDSQPWLLLPICLLQILFVVFIFTPIHDASHRSASKNRFLNDFILMGGSPLFLSSGLLFKRIHMLHHSKTNQPKLDPDQFTKGKSLAGRWLRSFLLVFYYYYFSIRRFWHDRRCMFHYAASVALILGVLSLIAFTPFGMGILWSWLVPSFIGLGILSFINTSWPHHPGEERNRYKHTRNLLVPRPLQWVMMNQNLHFVHHYRPNLPWHQYRRFWSENKAELEAKGVVTADYRL